MFHRNPRCVHVCCIMLFSAVSSLSAATRIVKEDLSACALPHAEMTLPDRNLPEARGGYILDFSAGVLKPAPAGAQPPRSAAEFLQRIREHDAGDLIYSGLNGGTFLAISARVADLGPVLLQDLNGKEIPRPAPVSSATERNAAGEATPGALEKLQPQHTYIVETVEGRFALVRLIQQGDRRALIQYVYQPDGTRRFAIPKAEVIPLPEPRGDAQSVRPVPRMPDGSAFDDVDALLTARRRFIPQLMVVLSSPQADMSARLAAIRALGELRAEEAVPVLLDQLSLADASAPMREIVLERLFPAVAALQKIGKPASVAAAQAIADVDLDDADGARPLLRLQLLMAVIEGVEGPALGRHLVELARAKAPERKHAVFDRALAFLRE